MARFTIICAVALASALVVKAGQTAIDIAYLADDANDEAFARKFVPMYVNKTLQLTPNRDNVVFKLHVVRTDERINMTFIDELNRKVAFYFGDYNDNFAKHGLYRKGRAPYIITGKSGFINQLEMISLMNITCRRSKSTSNDVVTFFPPRTVMTWLLLKTCPRFFKRMALIGENAYEVSLLLNTMNAYKSSCYHIGTYIISKDFPKKKGMKILRNALKLNPDVIAVYSFRMDYISKVFRMAQEANMLTHQYKWFILHPDILGIPDELNNLFKESYANVTGFQLISRDTFRRFQIKPPSDYIIKHASIFDTMIKLALSLHSHFLVFGDASTKRFTGSMFRNWMMTKNWQGHEEAIGFSTAKYITEGIGPVDGGFCRSSFRIRVYTYEGGKMHMVHDMHDDDLRLSGGLSVLFPPYIKIYQLPHFFYMPSSIPRLDYLPENHTLQIHVFEQPFGFWKFPPKKMPIFYKNNIRAVAIMTPPMVMKKKVKGKVKRDSDKYTGMMVDYLRQYSKELNVTFSIDKVVRNRKELLLELDSGFYDVGIGSLGMSTSLKKTQTVPSHTDTVRLGRIALLTKKPTVRSYPWQFLQPFTWAVWVSLGIVFIVTSMLLTLMDIFDWTDESFPVRDSFYYTAGLLCSGSTDTTPATVPSRLMICCLMFFSIVVINSYTANMTAFLTMRKSEDLPHTLHALSAQNSMNYSYVKDSEVYSIFTDSDIEPYGAIVNRRKARAIPLFVNIKAGVQAVRHKKKDSLDYTILITEEYTAKYFAAQHCDLQVILQVAEPIYYTIMLPLGAKYRENLNEVILTVREGYKDFDSDGDYYKQAEDCEGDTDDMTRNAKTRSLQWDEMVGVFYVLLMGAGLAILVGFIGEIYVRLILKKKRERHPWKEFKNDCKGKIAALREIISPWAGIDSKKK